MPKKGRTTISKRLVCNNTLAAHFKYQFYQTKAFRWKTFSFCLSRRFEALPPPRSQNSFEDKKNNRRKEKIFSGTKVQLYIDKGKKLFIYQCYFGETMQVKDFHDQALKESEREEYWIRLITLRGSLMLWRGDYVRFIYSNVVVTAISYSTS